MYQSILILQPICNLGVFRVKVALTQTFIDKLPTKTNYYDVWCAKMQGLHIRVSPKGKMTYRCLYQRGKIKTLGKVGILSLTQAREQAKQLLAQVAMGQLPDAFSKSKNDIPVLKDYIDHDYAAWRLASRKNASDDLRRLRVNFIGIFGDKKLTDIHVLDLEKWCSKRLSQGIMAATINRDMTILKAAFSKAVVWQLIKENPLTQWRPLKVDSQPKVRYLEEEEEKRLRKSLETREVEIKVKRSSGNVWRSERGYELRQDLTKQKFVDYLKPMVLLSLNTGIRKGECLKLKWENVDFTQEMLTIVGEDAKSAKTRHIPLNREALMVLTEWRKQTCSNVFVFLGKEGNAYTTVKKSWCTLLKKADIKNFRWHDIRHHFASKLVMRGVDLNTVRELLGHSDLTMTLRYAHLAPEHKAKAVAKLLEPE